MGNSEGLSMEFSGRKSQGQRIKSCLGQTTVEYLSVLEARESGGKWDPKLKVRLRGEKNPIFCYHPNPFHLVGEIPHDRGIQI